MDDEVRAEENAVQETAEHASADREDLDSDASVKEDAPAEEDASVEEDEPEGVMGEDYWILADGTTMTMDELADYMEESMDNMPEQFASVVENVAFFIDNEPTRGDLRNLNRSHPDRDYGAGGSILGLYSGVPITERSYGYAREPDIIKLFAGPICRYCRTRESVREQVNKTLIHEVGHYFGLDDAELRRMGY